MNEARETQEKPQRPMGVLSCLTTGFEVVARNPALIIMPVLLDVWLWLGPRLSLAPLLRGLETDLSRFANMDGLPEAAIQNASDLIQILKMLQERFNLFSLLHPAPLIGVPTLFTNTKLWSTLSPLGERMDVDVSSFFVYFGWQVMLPLAGLALSAIYLQFVGKKVIDETESPLPGPQNVWRIWPKMVLMGLILYLVAMSLTALVLTVTTMFAVVHPYLGLIAMTFTGSIALFVLTHLIFTIPGILQLRRGILRAIKESVMLTRGDFFGVTMLLTLILVVSLGLNFVWCLPTPDSWSMLVGIGGHAFTSTGLIATLFVFYQDRLRFIRALQKAFSAQTQTPEANSSVSKFDNMK